MTDTRTYIKVHDGMPDHPKVDGLSDKAFRLLVTSWCWCSRHLTDGRIPAATWRRRSTPKARKELVAAGLVVEVDGGDVVMHDYLEHQRSAVEVAEARAAKAQGGRKGNHRRWHVDKGIVDPTCPLCMASDDRSDKGSHNRSHNRSDKRQPPRSQNGNGEHDKRSVTEKNSPEDHTPDSGEENAAASENRSDPPSDNRSDIDRFGSPTTTTETETEGSPTGIPSSGATSRHPADRYAREQQDDEDDLTNRIETRIIELIHDGTGHTVDRAWAARVRAQILNDRQVSNPLAYVAAAIRGEPDRYLPTPGPASARVRHEPWMDVPDLGARDNGETNARGRRLVEEAIAAAKAQAAAEGSDEP